MQILQTFQQTIKKALRFFLSKSVKINFNRIDNEVHMTECERYHFFKFDISTLISLFRILIACI